MKIFNTINIHDRDFLITLMPDMPTEFKNALFEKSKSGSYICIGSVIYEKHIKTIQGEADIRFNPPWLGPPPAGHPVFMSMGIYRLDGTTDILEASHLQHFSQDELDAAAIKMMK